MPPRRFPKRVKADVDGRGVRSYRSKGEYRLAQQLHDMGVDWDYETEKLTFTVEHTYVLDFLVETFSGHQLYIEYKGWTPGWADGSDREKLLRIQKLYPDLDIRLVFDSHQFSRSPIRPGSKTRNIDWADKHGFKWAVEEIPEEWLDE